MCLAELEKQKTQDRKAYTDSITAMNDAINGSDGSGVCPEDNSNSAAVASATPGAISNTDEFGREVCLESSRSSSPTPPERLTATSPHVTNDEEEAPNPSSNRSDTRDDSSAVAFPRRNLHASFGTEACSESEYEQSQSDDSTAKPSNELEETKEDTAATHVVGFNDPNIVKPGEHLQDYAVLDSDGENEGHSVYDDDDDIGPIEPAAEDAAVALDLHFNPALLGVVGGVAELARGNVHKDVLTDIKFNGWSAPSTEKPYPYMHGPYEARPADWMKQDYPGIYDGGSGPTADALAAAASALWEKIAGASDDYFYETSTSAWLPSMQSKWPVSAKKINSKFNLLNK
ncbi:hypothetical protein L916_02989 [Phytophthora nicotianae]|uniref:Uncharacterized protein n=1 Tax=Phytophthora nicotianae TaxID=4792 RepID=W2JLC7_PHYNI|nr:hypothetical protein L916_02989 [Phytophthora nicotianae]